MFDAPGASVQAVYVGEPFQAFHTVPHHRAFLYNKEAAAPTPMQLRIGTIDLSKIVLDYANDVSALYTTLNLGHLKTTGRRLDLTDNTVHLEDLILENTTAAVRMGKTAGAQVVKEEAAQEDAGYRKLAKDGHSETVQQIGRQG